MNAKIFSITTASLMAAASFSIAQQAAPEALDKPQVTQPAQPAIEAPKPDASSPSAGVAGSAPAPAPAPPAVAPVPAIAATPPAPAATVRPSALPASRANSYTVFPGSAGTVAVSREEEEVNEPESMESGDEGGEEPLATALIDEDRDLNLDKAMSRYQSIISRFDRQRANAAQAVFRMGECYRKMGRMEEAKAQYGRILREFSDQPALVQSSQRYLFRNSGSSARMTWFPGKTRVQDSGPESGASSGNANISANANYTTARTIETVKKDAASSQIDSLKQQLAKLQQELAAKQQEGQFAYNKPFAKPSAEQLEQQKIVASIQLNLETITSGLELARANARNSERQVAEIQNKLRAVEGAKPEHLPPPADSDAQYTKLREEYTSALLARPVDKDRLSACYEKLRNYVAELYRPTLEEGLKVALVQLERSTAELEHLTKRKMDLTEQMRACQEKIDAERQERFNNEALDMQKRKMELEVKTRAEQEKSKAEAGSLKRY